ncbi:MAG: efflux RND transporter permease subunit, partial [Bacteroidia bacterium]
AGILVAVLFFPLAGIVLLLFGVNNLLDEFTDVFSSDVHSYITIAISVIFITLILAESWLPLGPARSLLMNTIFVFLIIGFVLGFFLIFIRFYRAILKWCLANKGLFLLLPAFSILLGVTIWLGFGNVFGFVANSFDKTGMNIRTTKVWHNLYSTFPGIDKEFMPRLDEGSFLLMPILMPHAGIEESLETLKYLDKAVQSIPEVELVVGKIGRAESALDPAPVTMFENVINYKSEYKLDDRGRRVRFATDNEGEFIRDENGNLVPDSRGSYYRQWRDHIRSPRDIWDEIAAVARYPGLTTASMLQPIETRLVMLQTGTRASTAMLVQGPDLQTIEDFSLEMENILQDVPGVNPPTVFADRIVGKPYLEIDINRRAIARHGLTIRDVQDYVEVAIGGMTLTTTVEGRERYPVRVRYAREFRDNPHDIERILVSTPSGAQIPLGQLADINYVQGPQAIRSVNTFPATYVIFDILEGSSAVAVVENAQNHLDGLLQSGELELPEGVSYRFIGEYENQVRAEKRLSIVIPLVLLIILMLLYFQFRSLITSFMIFSAIAVAFSGGFIMIWFYGQDWFMNFSLFGAHMRDLFQIHPINLSIAVWVGFLALFGIATDDGVVMATYLKQSFARNQPENIQQIRESVVEAGSRRVRPCLMTTATTLLALLPILTSTGKGSDIMIPMAIPAFGGMTIVIMTLFVIPVLYALWQETLLKSKNNRS